MVVIDIEVPTREERAAVWEHAATLYPSLRFLDREELVVLSAHMSRYDIYMAAREAVEQAYRMSIERRAYVPVTRDNIFDKIAAYQPLDSDEYHKLEDAAVESLRDDLDHINDPLEGSAQ
jgi:SpoVK/Ycf46/Vps4 family AAA+-type ATPase